MSAQKEGMAELDALLQFLYLCPVGIAKLALTGHVELMNPKACQLLMPLVRTASIENLFDVLYPYAPDLKNLVDACGPRLGMISESRQLEIPAVRGLRQEMVLALTLIKVDTDSLMAVLVDISRLVEQERLIRSREERLRAIFEGIRDYAIYTLDTEGRIDTWNPSVQRVEGYEAHEIVGQTLGFDLPSAERESAELATRLRIASQSGRHEDEGWRVRRDGSRFWANTIVSVLRDGKSCGYSVIARDITERKRNEDALRCMANTDPLTGAFNRRHFFEQAEMELTEEKRGAAAILLIDADHFKRINDTFGHPVGDIVLKELTAACLRCLRPTDLLARFGGEEFTILLRDTELPECLRIAESIRRSIAQCSVESEAGPVSFTVSIGAAPLTCSVQSALQRADEALYAAKQRGRNRVVSSADVRRMDSLVGRRAAS